MDFQFSPEVEARLRKSGWYPGRRIPDYELEALHDMRPLFPAARRVLQEFDRLYISQVGEIQSKNGCLDLSNFNEQFCIDAHLTHEEGEKILYDEYSAEFGFGVYPLGIILGEFYTVNGIVDHSRYGLTSYLDRMFIDEKGRVFIEFFELRLIGNSFEEALENLHWKRESISWDAKNDSASGRA